MVAVLAVLGRAVVGRAVAAAVVWRAAMVAVVWRAVAAGATDAPIRGQRVMSGR
ncbi:hypothetical protein [Plantactinospora sp. KBS50]|uniref:hypothetical protein n=1 Tax=Plantactinospora sp. KBS50 TaxID=2024580 RepID=UPI0012FDEA82|nr:hypothetical protein [Plantactinospora sp. KBS50]